MLNINGNLVQISGTPQATTTTNTQPAAAAVTSPATQTVVPQTLTTAAPNQLAMANGNLVMVRNATDVRNTINISKKKTKILTFFH